jgi:hypothetical protein
MSKRKTTTQRVESVDEKGETTVDKQVLQASTEKKKKVECVRATLTTFEAKCRALPANLIDSKLRETYGKCYDAMVEIAEEMTGMDLDKEPQITSSVRDFITKETKIPEAEWPREILRSVFQTYDDMLWSDAADFWNEDEDGCLCLEMICGVCMLDEEAFH